MLRVITERYGLALKEKAAAKPRWQQMGKVDRKRQAKRQALAAATVASSEAEAAGPRLQAPPGPRR